MTETSRPLRAALGRFTTGVAIVTLESESGEPVGMTMNSFSSVSLDPPLVLFSVSKDAFGLEAFRRAQGYAVNVLCEDQEPLSSCFARPSGDKWNGLGFTRGYKGAPLLEDTLAHFECAPWATYDGGDHLIFVCRVVAFACREDRHPLVFYGGRYACLDPDASPPGGTS